MSFQSNGSIDDSPVGTTEVSAIAQLRDKIKDLTVPAVGGGEYVRVETLKRWMETNGTLKKLVAEAFYPEHFYPDTASDIRDYLIVFAILLTIEYPNAGRCIEHFRTYRISDAQLPVPKDYMTQLHNNSDSQFSKSELDDLATQFDALQWSFCPIKFELNMHPDVRERAIIPICKKQLIKGGGSAKVWQILVQEEFVDGRLRKAVENNPHGPCIDDKFGRCYSFALKTFDEHKINDWKDEKHAFHGLREHEGMIRCLGTFQSKVAVKEDNKNTGKREKRLEWSHNILLEYSELDLKDVFGKRLPPVFPDEIYRTWKALLKIAEAVDKLHNLELEGENESTSGAYYGWHADIKPSNILSVEGQYRLADPGFARFLKKKLFAGQSLPKTVLSGGTETYAAPERLNEKNKVSQRVDTWSLGCVLSLAATWIVLGYSGIEQYRRVRCDALKAVRLRACRTEQASVSDTHPLLKYVSRNQNELDLFHDGTDVLKEVREWHALLRASARRTDNTTTAILDVVDEHMLVGDENNRARARDVCDALDNALKAYEQVKLPEQTNKIVQQLRDLDSDLPDDPSPRPPDRSPEHSKRTRNHNLLSITPARMRTSHRSEHLRIEAAEPTQDHGKLMPRQNTFDSVQTQDTVGNHKRISFTDRRKRASTASQTITHAQMHQNVIQAYLQNERAGWKGKDPELASYFVGRDRDIVFLVDNSTSMRPFWDDATFLLHMIEQKISRYDSDGLELRFTHSNSGVANSKGKHIWNRSSNLNFRNAMQQAEPKAVKMQNKTDMAASLHPVFRDYIESSKSYPRKKFTLIVLTDGRWEAMKDKDDVRKKIREFMVNCKDMGKTSAITSNGKSKSSKLRPVSIQFVQFGQDAEAILRMRHLDNELIYDTDFAGIGDVVDHEIFEIRGDVNKMILGSFEPDYDAIDTSADVVSICE